mmetsp:Transcript_23822/g.59925  ORF Transcript_23822/g.59925 Transcript_23822/m.59925 type:complete len:205 (+) Transcript_23822:656-1270(+)
MACLRHGMTVHSCHGGRQSCHAGTALPLPSGLRLDSPAALRLMGHRMRGTPRSAEEMEEGLAAQAAARKRQRAAPAGLAAGPSAPPPAAAAPGGFPGLLGMAGFANFWAPEAAAAGVGPGAADPEALRVMGTLMSRLDECLAVERQRRETELSMWRQHEQHMLNQISVLREQLEVDHSQISMLRQLVTEQNHSISDLIGPMDRA